MSVITIEGMEFNAFHGCFEEERIIGNKFVVDVIIESNTKEAESTDDLSKTINYQLVYKIVKDEMQQHSKLLEHIAKRIIDSLHLHFETIDKTTVTVSKMHPSLASGGFTKKVSVTLYN